MGDSGWCRCRSPPLLRLSHPRDSCRRNLQEAPAAVQAELDTAAAATAAAAATSWCVPVSHVSFQIPNRMQRLAVGAR